MIPKIFHFIFGLNSDFGNKPFSLVHYIALKSAYEVNRPDKMFLYCSYEPQGELWELSKTFVEVVKITAPTTIFGNLVEHYAHKADIIRLTKLIEIGGVYLDMDTICINSFDNLLNNKFVMCKQEDRGFCNAIMLSEKNSEFGNIWYETYKTFDNTDWDYHSVVLPKKLIGEHPELITTLETEMFFQPNFNRLDLIFEQFVDKSKSYAFHLWEAASWDVFLKNVDKKWILDSNSTYAHYAKKYI